MIPIVAVPICSVIIRCPILIPHSSLESYTSLLLRSLLAPTSMSLNKWIHVALVVSMSDGACLYLNTGFDKKCAPWSPGSLQNLSFSVGGSTSNTDQGVSAFQGVVDEMSIYVRKLTPREVSDLAGVDAEYAPVARFDFEQSLVSSVGLGKASCISSCPHYYGGIAVEGDFAAAFESHDCLRLGGADYLGFSVTHDFTVSFWMQAGLPGKESSMPKATLLDLTPAISLSLSGSELQLSIAAEKDTTIQLSGPGIIHGPYWTHVAVRLAQAYATLFVNGTGTSRAIGKIALASSASVSLGCSGESRTSFFTGLIDDVSFYADALPDKAVREIAAGNAPEGMPAAEADCTFDDALCAWKGDDWLRWQGAASTPSAGPLRDHGSSALSVELVPCDANGHSFAIVDNGEPITLPDAQKRAHAMGGYLATIASAEEQSCVTELTDTLAWLGATDEAAPGVYQWLDGSDTKGRQLTYTNWRSGEPEVDKDEHWLGINWFGHPRGSWHDCSAGCPTSHYVVEFEHASSLVYSSNFSNGVDGWTSSTDSAAVAECGAFGTVLGPPGVLGKGASLSKTDRKSVV